LVEKTFIFAVTNAKINTLPPIQKKKRKDCQLKLRLLHNRLFTQTLGPDTVNSLPADWKPKKNIGTTNEIAASMRTGGNKFLLIPIP